MRIRNHVDSRVLNYLYDLYCFFMQPRALIKRAPVFREQYSHADIMMAHTPTNTRIQHKLIFLEKKKKRFHADEVNISVIRNDGRI